MKSRQGILLAMTLLAGLAGQAVHAQTCAEYEARAAEIPAMRDSQPAEGVTAGHTALNELSQGAPECRRARALLHGLIIQISIATAAVLIILIALLYSRYRMKARVSAELKKAAQTCRISMTFGVVQYRKGESLDPCIGRADAAMYQGKAQGKNRIEAA